MIEPVGCLVLVTFEEIDDIANPIKVQEKALESPKEKVLENKTPYPNQNKPKSNNNEIKQIECSSRSARKTF